MAFVRANGGVIHFADEGPRAARAVVFVNSLGCDFRIWDEVARPLATHTRVIRYDKRGHGLSERIAGEASIDDFADDLAGLIDALEAREATIVGLSIGGMIAQALARRRADLARSLVLCDTGHRIGSKAAWTNRIEAVKAGGIEAIADGVIAGWFTREFHLRRAEDVAGWRAMLTRAPQAGYLAACGALSEADLTAAAKAIRVPTLVLVGEEDPSTPVALARELAGLIAGARLEIIPRAAHIPCIERPDIVRGLIEAHLKELAP